jgi:D-glycero-alpha-D-manno-heptose-7-phosphate kinase
MSFFGGGTDMPEFFQEHGGAVISTTFNKYCYVSVRHLPRFFDYSNQVTYSKIERVKDVLDIEHPAVREAMKMMDMHELIISYDADLPARTGLATSSSFAVGMLNAFYALKGKMAGKKQLADDAIYLERDLCKEAGGWQDQVAVAYGGLNRIDFSNSEYTVRPVIISPDRKKELNQNLLLFFTGFSRMSAEIQVETKKHIQDKIKQLLEMKSLVGEAEKVLTDKNNDLHDFGRLLDYTWKLKRQTGSRISTDSIDEVYNTALIAGATGGKLLGAGGGGFLLFYVERERQPQVREALNQLMEVPFCFEDEGASILYYTPEMYSRT